MHLLFVDSGLFIMFPILNQAGFNFIWGNFYFKPVCGVVGFVRNWFFFPLSSGSIPLDLQLSLNEKTVSQISRHSPAGRPVP